MKIGLSTLILCAGLLASCVSGAQDRPVTLSLTNGGAEGLHCRLMFGHWVDRDLGELEPGETTTVGMTQAAEDGALYIMRSDGARKMMIETIQCAQPGNWMQNFGQVDFAPIRSRRARLIEAICAAPAGGGRTVCRLDRID
ncbi:hypothetical protein [Dongia deserti]|uniref:hypothetical protein n=1 Tax=Dongia deserti TaxID=2268030 RepID=UPI000E648CFF|nr:hypothetical protein [Dongia deserti]